MQPMISIIVPVYNVQDYVRECMDSLVNQTLKNIEIVLVDNGSRDGSTQIINEYAQRDDRIRIVTLEQNQGMPKARNIGLEVATGEYIAFVDSDDLCDITMYEKLYHQAKRFDADIVTCNVLRFTEDWRKGTDHHPEIWYSETDRATPITGCPEQFMEQAAWAKILKHSYIKKLPYKFTAGSVCCEDVPACTHVFLNTDKIALVNETLYFYRNRPNSLSNRMNKKYTEDFVWAMKQQNEIIKALEFHDDLTMGIIVEMRFLLANHILSKMQKKDVPHYFDHMKHAFREEDRRYLHKFFEAFPHSEKLFDGILSSDKRVYGKLKRLHIF